MNRAHQQKSGGLHPLGRGATRPGEGGKGPRAHFRKMKALFLT